MELVVLVRANSHIGHERKVSEIVNGSARSLGVSTRQRQGQIEKCLVLIPGRERRNPEKKKRKTFLTTVFEGRADHNRLRNLTSVGPV